MGFLALKYMKRFWLVGAIVMVALWGFAQEYSTKSKRAIKAYELAIGHLNQRDYEAFFEAVKEAIDADTSFTEAYLLAMQGAIEDHKYKLAEEYGEAAYRQNPTLHPPLASMLGKLYLLNGSYDKAVECFTFFLKTFPNQKHKVEEQLERALFAKRLKDNPVRFTPINMGDSVNTRFDDYWPSISGDGYTFVKTSNIPSIKNEKILQEDFFESVRSNGGEWRKSIPMRGPINTQSNEGAQSLTADGRAMYFTKCINDCNLYHSKLLKGGSWGAPELLPSPINTVASDKQPSISSDGQYLFFTSNRDGGYGGYDLYVATRDMETGEWLNVKNLGPKVNTPRNEVAPFIHFDGRTLYFASDGHKGLGGLDLFVTRKDKDGSWGEPVNLGYPINTYGEEQGIAIAADAKTTYIASNRESGKGLDIYYFELPDSLKPLKSAYVKGRVVDALTKKPLAAEVVLANLKTREAEFTSSSSDEDGSFFTSLPSSISYAMQVQRKGYLFYSHSFMLDSTKSQQNPLELYVELQPLKVGSTTVLRNVYFGFNAFNLKSESEVELRTLVELLKSNPTLWIEIAGHTDNVGNAKYNQNLSERRAQSVVSYLVSEGIDKNRLRAVGYGSARPVAPNTTEDGRAKNRRTEFKVLYL